MPNNLLSSESRKIVCAIGGKLADPNYIIQITQRKENSLLEGRFSPWEAITFAQGYPSLIILFSELASLFPLEGWERVCQNYTLLLIKELEKQGIFTSSLFYGLSGVCFALSCAEKRDKIYGTPHCSLKNLLLQQVKKSLLDPLERGEKDGVLPASTQYNISSGLSGILIYFLNSDLCEKSYELIIRMMKHLVRLTSSIEIENCIVPGWYAPSDYLIYLGKTDCYPEEALRSYSQLYPQGCFDTGISHGIAGCLAVLSLALSKGFKVDGQVEAIERIVLWLRKNQRDIGTIKKCWPKRFAFNPNREFGLELKQDHYFDGWSYGAPGILYAIFLSSRALNDQDLYNYCIENFTEIAYRLKKFQTLDCLSFSYGWAGVLAIMHRLFLETALPLFSQTSSEIALFIANQFREEYPFGFKCSPPTNDLNNGYNIDHPGLINGAAGIALSLLFSTCDNIRPWTQGFLLS